MRDPLGSRMNWAVVDPVAPYGDVGAVEIIVDRHPYLHCDADGERLYAGETMKGAAVLVCHICRRILDQRRVP